MLLHRTKRRKIDESVNSDVAQVTIKMQDLLYDEERLIQELNRLPVQLRVAFAAACVERVFPAYEHYLQQSGSKYEHDLRSLLQRLWLDLSGNSMKDFEIEEAIDNCMSVVERLNDSDWIEWQAAADGAATALCYALRCRKTGEPQEAAWAAQHLYEVLDDFVINREHIDTNQPGAERRVLAHPLIQAELARQRRTFEELLEADEANISRTVVRLQERAKAEAPLFFDSTS